MIEPRPDAAELLRRGMLVVVLAELCQLDPATILQPVCPHCAEGPAMALPGGQAWCGNDSCDVFMWRITDSRDDFDRKAKHLQAHEDERGGITWRPADE